MLSDAKPVTEPPKLDTPSEPATAAPEPAIEDIAANDYMKTLPKFLKKMEELNNRSLKKVVAALFLHPFEKGEINWSYVKEYELFKLGIKINDCRFVLMKTVMDMKKEEIEALLKETEEKPSLPQETKEETNGSS